MPFAVMNVVTIEPEEAAALTARLESASFGAIRGQAGFRSARLYRSEDDTQVVTITEWSTREDFLAYRQTDDARRAVADALAAHPKISFYEIVAAIEA